MSSEITSMFNKKMWIVPDSQAGRLEVRIGRTPSILVRSDDLLAAVATECDAIVIPRADLPPIERIDGDLVFFEDGSRAHVPTSFDPRWHVVRWLAVEEYRKAHPPVDEAQVEALAGLLGDADTEDALGAEARDMARRLLATGRVTVN